MIKKRPSSGNNSGFTIIEIFVLILIICVLAAVVFPNYVDFENQTRLAIVKGNMKIVQMAVEAYATDNNGDFPLQGNSPELKSYFPGGNCNSQSPKGGNYPENPFTHKEEAPAAGTVTVEEKPEGTPPLYSLSYPNSSRVAGKIFYGAIIPTGQDKGTGYIIEGADSDGKAITDKHSNASYILSNLGLHK